MHKDRDDLPRDIEPGRAFLPALGLALASGLFLLGLGLRAPHPAEPVALLFAPGVTAEDGFRRVAALDGRVLRAGGWDNVVVAVFDRDIGFGQLWAQGIWAGFDPVFLGGCSATGTRSAAAARPNDTLSQETQS